MTIGPVEVIIALVLWLVPAIFVARLAGRRGQPALVVGLLCILIPWPMVLVILLVVTSRGGPETAPTPEQTAGAWGVTTGSDSYATEHDDR